MKAKAKKLNELCKNIHIMKFFTAAIPQNYLIE